MSDPEFERRVGAALREPVPTSAHARMAIMQRIRLAARDGMPARASFPAARGTRRSLIGVAIAAGIGSITAMPALTPDAGSAAISRHAITSVVIGDSVVDRLRDTLRLVRLMFDAPSAQRVAVVGDFNDWRRDATPLVRDERTGRWGVTLALHDGAHRYAIVVDNTRQAVDATSRSVGQDGRVHSLLHVGRATN